MMVGSNSTKEPSTAPKADRWYNLTLGSSFKDHHSSSKFCTLRYEFKPASIDKNQPGTLHKNKDNRVTVEFHNNQPGKPKVTFQGSSEDYKENDAVLFFDGEKFRLERLHRAVKSLRHVRETGESVAGAASAGPSAEASSPPVGKGPKFPSSNKALHPAMQVEVERIEIGDFKTADPKPRNEKVIDYPPSVPPNPPNSSPDLKNDELEEQLDIMNDDMDMDDIGEAPPPPQPPISVNHFEREHNNTGIDINIPHQDDMDDEIADVDVSDDEADKGPNAAEALRAQVNAEEGREEQTSSSSDSSGSESSGGSSSSASGSSSDSESSEGEGEGDGDGDSVNSI